jgi:hypothetical protein
MMWNVIPARFLNLTTARSRFGDRVDRLAPFLMRGDPLADAVIEEMRNSPGLPGLHGGRGFALLGEALKRPTGTGADIPPAMRTLFESIEYVPAWVDWGAMRRGGELLLRSGILGGIVLGAYSLVLGYASPGGNKPLVFSGRLMERAARRLAETSRFVQAVAQPDGFRRNGDAFAITLHVRLMHAQVRYMLRHSDKWNMNEWGEPINQHDMAATTLLFSLVFLDGIRKLGIEADRDESESFMHLWRYAGHLMGVDTEILPTSEFDAVNLMELIRATEGAPDEDSRALTRALLDSGITNVKSPKERRLGMLQREMGRGFCRAFLGQEMADALGVPKTPLIGAFYAFRAATQAAEHARKRSAEAHQSMVATGARYWENVVKQGLGAVPADFMPPAHLSRAS